MFFFKRKKITLDCFTDRPDVCKYTPIEFANKHYPEWWKKLPKTYNTQNPNLNNTLGEQPTMKGCPGLIDNFQYGVVLPLWSDIAIHITHRECNWQFSDHITPAQSHDPNQWVGFLPLERGQFHIKLESPWFFKTKDDIHWTFSQPTWNMSTISDYTVLPGVVSYKYQITTNINMIIHPKQDHRFIIEAGQPIAHITPLSEREVIIKNHLIDTAEFNKMRFEYGTTNKFEKNLSWHKKMIDRNEKSKCPFHFN